MGHFSSMFNGLAKTLSMKKGRRSYGGCGGMDDIAKEANRNDLILRSTGFVCVQGSNNFASVFSRRGEKGVNQDCFIVWEGFGCEDDTMFCGIFDGHGPWGHFVSKRVRETMPSSLLRNWQESITENSLQNPVKSVHKFNIWKHSYLKTCVTVDRDLLHNRKIDAFNSGTTALTIVRQGEQIFVANVGDSRAVLGTISEEEDGRLVAVQLTIDFKPNLPQEAERIAECKGRVFCLKDEPGVHRVWLPDVESPGLAMSRAFGDYSIKDFGLISTPQVTERQITAKDQFIILATDGVWDVISNEEAVEIVSTTEDKRKSAKRLVKCAANAWKRERKGYATDDISAICLFLHHSSSSLVHPVKFAAQTELKGAGQVVSN